MINVTNGKTNSHIGEKAMNFFMLISTASAQAQRYASANLFGPNIRSLRRFYRKVDQGNNLPPIINRKKEDIHQLVMNHIKKSFQKTDVIMFMTSIDGTSVGSALQEVGKALVGGAEPHHYIEIPEFPPEKYRNEEKQAEFVKKHSG